MSEQVAGAKTCGAKCTRSRICAGMVCNRLEGHKEVFHTNGVGFWRDELEIAVDWTDNKAVVRAAFPQYEVTSQFLGDYSYDGHEIWAIPEGKDWLDRIELGSSLLQDPEAAWAEARKHETVVAFERANNPAYAASAVSSEADKDKNPWNKACGNCGKGCGKHYGDDCDENGTTQWKPVASEEIKDPDYYCTKCSSELEDGLCLLCANAPASQPSADAPEEKCDQSPTGTHQYSQGEPGCFWCVTGAASTPAPAGVEEDKRPASSSELIEQFENVPLYVPTYDGMCKLGSDGEYDHETQAWVPISQYASLLTELQSTVRNGDRAILTMQTNYADSVAKYEQRLHDQEAENKRLRGQLAKDDERMGEVKGLVDALEEVEEMVYDHVDIDDDGRPNLYMKVQQACDAALATWRQSNG